MKIKLKKGEIEIKKGLASLQRKFETVGGKLYLTNKRLIFEAHRINVQTDTLEMELSALHSIKKSWTKFLGILPIMPNSLSIFDEQGTEFRFVLFGRSKWSEQIEAQKNK